MDSTIRNLDSRIYKEIKARAALAGRSIGDVVNEALRSYLATHATSTQRLSLRKLEPMDFPEGNEQLSEQIDAIVYGTKP